MKTPVEVSDDLYWRGKSEAALETANLIGAGHRVAARHAIMRRGDSFDDLVGRDQ